ncbi:MAG: cell division protein FtsZ [Clostridia bacterium]|nr:cell division protein FtsZ [Clostridia bacterium]
MSIEYDSEAGKDAKIVVIGVGGGGNNAVDRMIDSGMTGVDFVTMNTDKGVLLRSKADTKIQLGEKLTRGLGAGANPEIGEKAARESVDEIVKLMDNVDMVFITAGMGGGTGTGAAPVVAEIAKSKGILTVAVVTKPFAFEGRQKMMSALRGIEKLQASVDSLVIIPNDNIMKVVDEKVTISNAFKMVDEVLSNSVQGICDIITNVADVNVDFADVRATMSDKGIVHMGVGQASGKDRAKEALKIAVENPLLETSIKGAKSVLVYYYGDNINMFELSEVNNMVHEQVDPDAKIIFGIKDADGSDASISDTMQITIIAAGFGDSEEEPVPAIGLNFDAPVTAAPAKPAAPVEDDADVIVKKSTDDYDDDFDVPSFLKGSKR